MDGREPSIGWLDTGSESTLGKTEPSASATRDGQANDVGDEKLWKELYGDATLGQIIDEKRVVQAVLEEMTADYYERAWTSGQFQSQLAERGRDGGYKVPSEVLRGGALTSIRMDTVAGTASWVTLPIDSFPSAYKLKEKFEWLTGREEQLRQIPVFQSPR